jgi:hypothetical protein
MVREIIGTNKFIIYFYNGKMVKGGELEAKHFVYNQWGRIFKLDRNGKTIGDGYAFSNYGQMITYINKIMRKELLNSLKENEDKTNKEGV